MKSHENETGGRYIRPNKCLGPDIQISRIPAQLLCWRFVVHPYDKIENYSGGMNVTGAKHIMSLGHQMEYSIKRLQAELAKEGFYVSLELEKAESFDIFRRYNLFLDGTVVAVMDEDFGFDCFDVSTTTFKSKMREVVTLALGEQAVDKLLDEVFLSKEERD